MSAEDRPGVLQMLEATPIPDAFVDGLKAYATRREEVYALADEVKPGTQKPVHKDLSRLSSDMRDVVVEVLMGVEEIDSREALFTAIDTFRIQKTNKDHELYESGVGLKMLVQEDVAPDPTASPLVNKLNRPFKELNAKESFDHIVNKLTAGPKGISRTGAELMATDQLAVSLLQERVVQAVTPVVMQSTLDSGVSFGDIATAKSLATLAYKPLVHRAGKA